MNGWAYKARTLEGQAREGVLQAITIEDANRALVRMRLIPELVRPVRRSGGFRLRRGVKPMAMVHFARQFSTLIDAGVPLIKSIETLRDLTDDKILQSALEQVMVDVQSGKTLAAAMREHPRVFSDIFVNMVDAGERGGVLDTVMARLASYLEKSQAIVSKVKTAMVYPTVILAVAFASAAVMLTFVVPAFQTMFESSNLSLPYPTQVLVNISEFLQAYWMILLAGLAVGVILLRQAHRTRAGRELFDRFILRVPILGELVRKAAVARFSQSMAALLLAGVNLIDTLTAAASTTNNVILERKLLAARLPIEAGEGISKPLAESGVLPALVPRMVEVGEQTGSLDEMFDKIAAFFESEVDTAVDRLMKVLEPILLVVVGIILGAMVVALYLPIFEALTNIAPE